MRIQIQRVPESKKSHKNCRTFKLNYTYYIMLYLRLNTKQKALFYVVQYWNEMKHARLHTAGHLDSIKRLMTV